MIKLNDVQIPSFVKVNKVDFSILPPVENNLLKVRGKAGAYNLGQTVGTREITVGITIVAEEINGVMGVTRSLAEWLHHKEAVKLVINDEPDKYYMVVLDGDTTVEELLNIGQGEITFLCVEPYAFGESREVNFAPTEEPTVVPVGGTAETFPQVELTMVEDVTAISVITGDSYVTIGEEAQVTETPKNLLPVRLWDEMTNPLTWTSAIKVDDGTITGKFSSDGYAFWQENKDYGTGSTWHGASAIKSLPTAVAGDFEAHIQIGFKATKGNQLGRVEMYLLDQNNEQFGKLAIVDGSGVENHQRFEARVGKEVGGKYFIRDWGARRGVWSNFTLGKMIIKRTGNTWFAFIGIWDAKKKVYNTRLSREWVDRKNTGSNPLAKIQIHMGTYGKYAPYNSMNISDIKVYERLTLGAGQVPIIANVGDVLLIDNERAVVYKNGEPFFEGLNPSSKFFSFQKGNNGIAVSPPKANVKLTYTERWL